MERKLKVLQHILDEINIKPLYHISLASAKGQILIESQKINRRTDLTPVVETVAGIFHQLDTTLHVPSDIILNCNNEKIYIQKIPLSENSEPFLLLIASLRPNCLYFRRALKKSINQIQLFLN